LDGKDNDVMDVDEGTDWLHTNHSSGGRAVERPLDTINVETGISFVPVSFAALSIISLLDN
jgi:hypothetical protein